MLWKKEGAGEGDGGGEAVGVAYLPLFGRRVEGRVGLVVVVVVEGRAERDGFGLVVVRLQWPPRRRLYHYLPASSRVEITSRTQKSRGTPYHERLHFLIDVHGFRPKSHSVDVRVCVVVVKC